MNDITLRQTFTAAGPGPASRVTGPALLAQVNGADCVLWGSNFPDEPSSWQELGAISGFTPLDVTTSFAYIRVVATGACDVRISAADAPAATAGVGGGGGAGTSDTTEATQILVRSAVQSMDTKLSTLLGQTDGVEGPIGAAADAAATSDTGAFSLIALIKRALQNWTTLLSRLPASLGPKASSASLSVTPAFDATHQSGIVASDGVVLPIESLSQTLAYTSGNLTSVSVAFGGGTYVQSLTYTAGALSSVSGWIKQ